MAKKIRAAMPPDMILSGDWRVEWDAVDPVTGASVSGVEISETSLRVEGDAASLAAVQNPILLGVTEA